MYNRDLAGSGTIELHPDAYVFRGRERGVLLRGPAQVLRFTAEEIRNVVRLGARVQFATDRGRSGDKKQPFVFVCASDADAAAIVRMLPATKDADFTAGQEFGRKLLALQAADGGAISVTNTLIGANVLMYVVLGLLGAGWIETTSMRPYLEFAGNNGAATTGGEWWRLLTAMFAHYGLLHLLFNMIALYQVGRLVETLFGRTLYTLVYFGTGIIGGLATILWHGDKLWSAGASGAIFGVYGALLGYLVREKQGMPRSVLQPMMKSTLLFAGYNLLYGAANPHIDNMAHIGGFTSGIALGWLCALPLDRELRVALWPRRLGLGLVVGATAIGAGVAAAPRFDYRMRDELRWSDANAQRVKDEEPIARDGTRDLAAYAQTPGDTSLRTWVEGTALPFYAGWERTLENLPLTPGLATARRRDALVKVLRMKVASLQELRDAITRRDPGALDRFEAEQVTISAAVRAMPK